MPTGSLVKVREPGRVEVVLAQRAEVDPPGRLEQGQGAVPRRPSPAGGHHCHGGAVAPALHVSQGRDGQGVGQVQTIDEQDQGGVAPHHRGQELEGDDVAGPVGRRGVLGGQLLQGSAHLGQLLVGPQRVFQGGHDRRRGQAGSGARAVGVTASGSHHPPLGLFEEAGGPDAPLTLHEHEREGSREGMGRMLLELGQLLRPAHEHAGHAVVVACCGRRSAVHERVVVTLDGHVERHGVGHGAHAQLDLQRLPAAQEGPHGILLATQAVRSDHGDSRGGLHQ